MLEWSGHGVIVDDPKTNLRANQLDYCYSVEDNGASKYLNRLIDEDLIGK